MALNFPDSPSDGQKYTDATTGETWTYEASTNSWTSDGLTTAVGIQYKGGIDVTAAPPAGVKNGWQYTVTTGGTANAGFTGLSGNVPAGTTILYDGANWQQAGAGVLWSRTGTELSPVNAGDSVFTTGAVKVGGTTAAPNLQIKADGSVVANVGSAFTGRLLEAKIGGVSRLAFDEKGNLAITHNPQAATLLPGFSVGGWDAAVHIKGNSGGPNQYTKQGVIFYVDGTAYAQVHNEQSGILVFRTGATLTERLRIHPIGTSTFSADAAKPPAIFKIGTSEVARIDADGRLLVGASATVAGSAAKLQCTTTANLGSVAVYADNTAATAGGLVAGDIYRKADGTLMITF